MEEKYTTHSSLETKDLGRKLSEEMIPGMIVCLEGELGSGKTTFAQGFLEGVGAKLPYVSPTFVIMKQYDLVVPATNSTQRVYHVDAYRVEEKDLETLGFAEWCADPEGIVILEWPERVGNLIPKKALRVMFMAKSENERQIMIILDSFEKKKKLCYTNSNM